MAGYTDSAFRILCLENDADIVYTEMVSVEALWRKNKKTLNMLKLMPQEKNVILQLFGSKPESFVKALRVINQLQNVGTEKCPEVKALTSGHFSSIDVNLGCPAKKVYKTGAGAALMDNKKLAREIIKTVLKNTKLPVSIKIRSQVKNVSAIEFIEYIKDLPIFAIMIHGRSLKQGFSGPIDYGMIRNVKKLLPNIPVIANGGINNPEDAKIMLEKTNADGLGIARGAWGSPWLFQEIKQNKNIQKSWFEIKKIMLQHSELFLKQQQLGAGFLTSSLKASKRAQVRKPAPNKRGNLIPLRKHLIHYVKGLKNASELRQKIIKIKTLDDLKKLL